MNLHDIIPVEKSTPRFTAAKIKEANQTLTRIESLKSIRAQSSEIDGNAGKVIDGVVTKMQATFTRQRRDILSQFSGLPDSLMRNSLGVKDSIARFAQSPRVSLSGVRSLADAFGFVVIPWDYFIQNEVSVSGKRVAKSYSDCNLCTSEQGESYHKRVCMAEPKIGIAMKEPEVRQATAAFISEAEIGKRFVPYVLCPVSYYSLQHHVVATDDLPIYPGSFEQAFMGINMSVPMFRQFARKVSALESQANATSVRLDTVDTELKNLARRLGEMERAEEQRQREAVIARQREAAQAAQIAETTRRLAEIQRFIPYDPMLLAVPSDIGMLGEGYAVVGPCWGPDFDDMIATLRGYKRFRGQRKLISQIGW